MAQQTQNKMKEIRLEKVGERKIEIPTTLVMVVGKDKPIIQIN